MPHKIPLVTSSSQISNYTRKGNINLRLWPICKKVTKRFQVNQNRKQRQSSLLYQMRSLQLALPPNFQVRIVSLIPNIVHNPKNVLHSKNKKEVIKQIKLLRKMRKMKILKALNLSMELCLKIRHILWRIPLLKTKI